MTVAEALAAVPVRRKQDAVWLLTFILKCTRTDLLLDGRRIMSVAERKRWSEAWARRLKGEPLQYITGEVAFWGRDFLVTRDVLIPRPETEVLVELSLNLLKEIPNPTIVDVGTGSGVIAITLKLEREDASVTGTDISQSALSVARKNALRLGANVRFAKRDGISRLSKRQPIDLVVSNPPYLELAKDKVSEEVMKWEPRMALEPPLSSRSDEVRERAAWLAERFLQECERIRPRFSAFELSPRVAAILEKRWRSRPAARRVWRESDLAGRKRFLLIAWENA